MADAAKKYECAYLLPPSVPEEEVLMHASRLAKIVEEAGAVIRRSEAPKKRRLSYEIKKQINAYFGWIAFEATPESVKGIEKKIKNENILRYLIVEENDSHASIVSQRYTPSRRPAESTPSGREGEKPEEKLDLEALDKKLAEILGK